MTFLYRVCLSKDPEIYPFLGPEFAPVSGKPYMCQKHHRIGKNKIVNLKSFSKLSGKFNFLVIELED